MTKAELLEQIKNSISEEEWEMIDAGNIVASEFNRSLMKTIRDYEIVNSDMATTTTEDRNSIEEKIIQGDKKISDDKKMSDDKIISDDKKISYEKVEELEKTLKTYLSQYMADKPEGWKWIILGCQFNSFIREIPMHPIEVVGIKSREVDGKTIYECPAKELGKNSCCNFCVCKRMSNYDIMQLQAGELFKKHDHEKISEKLGIPIVDNIMTINMLGRDYKVNCISGEIEGAGHEEAMTIYDLLCYSKDGAKPANEYIVLHQLSKVQNVNSYAGSGMFKPLEDFFDGNEEKLEKALIELGGEKFGKGDVSYRLHLFEGLYIVISFWSSDEDFPASLTLMYDKNILDYMHYETAWYSAVLVTSKIKKLMQKN